MKYINLILIVFLIWGCAGSKIPDGINPIYYPSGNLKAEVTYLKGKKDGSAKEYYENGKLKAEYEYRTDQLQGSTIHYLIMKEIL